MPGTPIEPTQIFSSSGAPVRVSRGSTSGLTPSTVAGVAVTAAVTTFRIAKALHRVVRPLAATPLPGVVVRSVSGSAVLGGLRVDWMQVEVRWSDR